MKSGLSTCKAPDLLGYHSKEGFMIFAFPSEWTTAVPLKILQANSEYFQKYENPFISQGINLDALKWEKIDENILISFMLWIGSKSSDLHRFHRLEYCFPHFRILF